MAIQERLLELRYPIALVTASAVAVASLHHLGPNLADVVGFFSPLLLSTGCFLAVVAVLLRISPPPADWCGNKTGEELMDYVAGMPEEEEAAEKWRSQEETA